jgi:hypothetical protein
MEMLKALFDWLTESRAGFDQFFHDWAGASAARAAQSPQAALYAEPAFTPVREAIEARAPAGAITHVYWQRPLPVSMLIDEVEAIWAAIAERDDWTPFETKLADIAELGAALKCH